jgi:hypothetical protein
VEINSDSAVAAGVPDGSRSRFATAKSRIWPSRLYAFNSIMIFFVIGSPFGR